MLTEEKRDAYRASRLLDELKELVKKAETLRFPTCLHTLATPAVWFMLEYSQKNPTYASADQDEILIKFSLDAGENWAQIDELPVRLFLEPTFLYKNTSFNLEICARSYHGGNGWLDVGPGKKPTAQDRYEHIKRTREPNAD